MTPEIAELRAKAAYHRKEAAALYRKIARIEGYALSGPKPSCMMEVNGREVWMSERQFRIMERLTRDNDADAVTQRADLIADIACQPNTLRVFLSQLRRRLEVAGVTIETIGKKGLRLNVFKETAP